MGYVFRYMIAQVLGQHDDVIKWKHFPCNWPFVRRIHRSPVNSPLKGQWRGALIFSLMCAWTDSWTNNGNAGDLRRYCAHYDITVMIPTGQSPPAYYNPDNSTNSSLTILRCIFQCIASNMMRHVHMNGKLTKSSEHILNTLNARQMGAICRPHFQLNLFVWTLVYIDWRLTEFYC